MKTPIERILDMPMRHKLLYSSLLIAFIPALIIGGILVARTRSYMTEKTEQSLREDMQVMSSGLSDQMQRLTVVLENLTHNETLMQAFSVPGRRMYERYEDFTYYVDPLLKNTLAYNPEIHSLLIYTELNIPARGGCNEPLAMLEGMPWFAEIFDTHAAAWHQVGDELWLVKPMLNLSGYAYVRNLVVLSVSRQWVIGAINNLSGDKAGPYRWRIADAEQNVVFEYASGEIGDEEHTLWQQMPIDGTDLFLSYTKPVEKLGHEFFRLQLIVFAALAACVLMIISLSYYFARKIAKQIEDLHDKVRTILQEKQVIDLRSPTHNEVGDLSNDIHSMVTQIYELTQSLYQKEVETRELQLRVLKAQINPHFLYNVLSVINWKAVMINAADISQVTAMLAHFYRTINNKGREDTTLRNELQNVRSYIELRLLMQQENFDIVYDIDTDTLACQIINMVLQPIVENAIDHGINLVEGRRATLAIRTRRAADGILIEVEDDGVGMEPEEVAACLVEQPPGYGIKNVNERIKLTFGDAYGLTIFSEKDKGTVVTIRIPYIDIDAAERI